MRCGIDDCPGEVINVGTDEFDEVVHDKLKITTRVLYYCETCNTVQQLVSSIKIVRLVGE